MNSCSTCSTDLDMNATVSYPQQNCSQFEGLSKREQAEDGSLQVGEYKAGGWFC